MESTRGHDDARPVRRGAGDVRDVGARMARPRAYPNYNEVRISTDWVSFDAGLKP
jgi:hypothetical protein